MRLIDADVTNRWMERNNACIDLNILNAIPTIDPLNTLGICRCKDCIYLECIRYNQEKETCCKHRYGIFRPKETDYCSYAKRKENSNV